MQRWEQNEEKKKYLRSYQAAVRREREICDEIQRLRESRMFPSLQMPDGMPHGSGGNADLSEYAVQVEQEMEKLKEIREKQERLKYDIESKIKQMKSDKEKAVLKLKYIDGLTWERVADEMGYSVQGVHNIHSKALINFIC